MCVIFILATCILYIEYVSILRDNNIVLSFLQYSATPTFNSALFSTAEFIAISVVISFTVALFIGFIAGLLVMYLCVHKKAVNSLTAKGQANVGPTGPAGPVYEEVPPKEEIELNTNKAYGQV